MKNSINIVFAFLILTLSSCSDDFLDKKPVSEISSGNFWQLQADAEAGIAGAYDALQPDSYYGFDMYVFGDVRSDNCFAGGDNPDNFAIDNFKTFPTNGTVTRSWRQIYTAISRANTAIDRITNMDPSLFEDGKKEALLGEAHFLRGLHYFNLVRLYGGVPLVIEETTSLAPDDIKVPRNTETEVYQQIIKDLKLSAGFLDGKNQAKGRATVGAAESLLAKVYLTLQNYPETVIWTGRAMTRGYSLLPVFENLFNQENQNNAEVIFAVQYAGGAEGNVFPELVLPTPEASFDFLKFNTPTPNSEAIFSSNDVRKATSIADRNGTLYLYKWRNGTAFASSDNNVILRYADVLLMRAEALNQTGDTNGAIALLNQIRNRAGLGDYTGSTSQSVVDAAIFEERRIELAFEGHRWFDLKRKGFNVANNAIQQAKGITIQPYQLLFPLPQEEIDRNELLVQNPNY
ncbi:RagB/SusD family nutrient uptake outer membrane protein [Galbibacter sp. BG1]|uniref:RagB/SusD family nutrient uptake outer membrane protein n=1 Tax=Galbibacter sp. BG1 TaxID=1170699 RepID=UPI0015BEB679|nr:RagB/SusD family nutrient uptake outer membrane protein [Galbibacter sp. BG1]QLE01267.1 RagB/SusD family nutrient uptake outer membrane protein [Galbibacter sp. BG1]